MTPPCSAFRITRAYLNVLGTISPAISFRVTPDVTRDTGGAPDLTLV